MKHIFSVVRFVPDPGRGEFVNVGVLASCPSERRARLRLEVNRKRAKAIDEKGVLLDFERYLKEFRSELDARNDTDRFDMDADGLGGLWERSRNVIQYTRPAPVHARNLETALDMLSAEFLVPPSTEAGRERGPNKTTALSRLRNSYKEHGLEKNVNYVEKPTLEAENFEAKCDFAVLNGRAVQIAQAWNFRVQDLVGLTESVKAWAFTLERVRDSGGQAYVNGDTVVVPTEVEVEALYVSPESSDARDAFAEASEAFDKINAHPLLMRSADDVGRRAAELLASSTANAPG